MHARQIDYQHNPKIEETSFRLNHNTIANITNLFYIHPYKLTHSGRMRNGFDSYIFLFFRSGFYFNRMFHMQSNQYCIHTQYTLDNKSIFKRLTKGFLSFINKIRRTACWMIECIIVFRITLFICMNQLEHQFAHGNISNCKFSNGNMVYTMQNRAWRQRNSNKILCWRWIEFYVCI